ncbi:MAG: type II toxin-antitoxin system VapC family toxin [Polyangia bacterium]|nr:type II toxin-antitoxin system VapC family toxin [Polyangia bacterium]
MSEALLDTHAFLWFVFDDPRLPSTAAKLIEDETVTKILSVASLWEIVIKSQIGKLSLGMELETFFEGQVLNRDLEILDIDLRHLVAYGKLPLVHRDPFDRLLVAQARVLGLPIVTSDPIFSEYDVPIVWD